MAFIGFFFLKFLYIPSNLLKETGKKNLCEYSVEKVEKNVSFDVENIKIIEYKKIYYL